MYFFPMKKNVQTTTNKHFFQAKTLQVVTNFSCKLRVKFISKLWQYLTLRTHTDTNLEHLK